MLRFLSEDDYLAAVQDAADDRFLEVAVKCAECGTLWTRATIRPPDSHPPNRAGRVPQLRVRRDQGGAEPVRRRRVMLASEADVLRTLHAGTYTLEQLYGLCEQRAPVDRDGGHDPVPDHPGDRAGSAG